MKTDDRAFRRFLEITKLFNGAGTFGQQRELLINLMANFARGGVEIGTYTDLEHALLDLKENAVENALAQERLQKAGGTPN